jgi:hypothetical protein
MTAAQRLAELDAAISALLTGGASSYSIGGRSVTKLNLNDLVEERRQLAFEVVRESTSGFSLAKMGKTR